MAERDYMRKERDFLRVLETERQTDRRGLWRKKLGLRLLTTWPQEAEEADLGFQGTLCTQLSDTQKRLACRKD